MPVCNYRSASELFAIELNHMAQDGEITWRRAFEAFVQHIREAEEEGILKWPS